MNAEVDDAVEVLRRGGLHRPRRDVLPLLRSERRLLPRDLPASAHALSIGCDLNWDLTDSLSLQGLASWYDRSDDYASPGIAPGDQIPPNGAKNDLERDNASLRLTARRGDWLEGTTGIDFQRESGRSDGYVDFAPDVRVPNSFSLDRDIIGIFAEARVRPSDAWLLEASIRHDEPDEVSGETTGASSSSAA